MILGKLKSILNCVDPTIDSAEITPEKSLEDDLGIDSLSMMMIALEIEKQFNFRFDLDRSFKTVGDVCDYVEEKTAAQ